MARILIIEDEHALNDLIAMSVKMTGHEVIQMFNSSELSEVLLNNKIDLAILDVMLPGKSGFEIVTDITKYEIPVIFLTAKDNVADKVHGLNLGAEDYITKPFETIELLARINVVLRRRNKNTKIFILENLKVYLDERKVTLNDKIVELTIKEFDILELFINNKNIALSREHVIKSIWGYDFMGETRSVDVHIQKIRKKLLLENHLKTVYKFGYRLEVH
jgi:two-component system, OmpR family, alkaline phosphatase synthesis response regulator PhoP